MKALFVLTLLLPLLTSNSYNDATLNILFNKIGERYQERLAANGIEGAFFQAGQYFPVNLSRNAVEKHFN